MYAVSNVWLFDRLIRVLRVCRSGMCRTTVTEIRSDIVRVDVERNGLQNIGRFHCSLPRVLAVSGRTIHPPLSILPCFAPEDLAKGNREKKT